MVCQLSSIQADKINMQISYRIALIIIQLTAIIFAIYFWKNYKNSNQRYFLLFIIFSLIIDQANGIISIYLDQRISIFHNILVIVSGFFYLYWFNKILKKKTVTKSLLAVFSLFSIYTLATLNLKTDFFSDLLTVQIIFILICSLLYFIELIKINKVIDYYKSQKFWIVIGLLIFYIVNDHFNKRQKFKG